MIYLQDKVASTAMPRKRYVHDCVDTGNDFPLLDGVPVLFPCDCVSRDYKVDGKNIWDKTNHVLKDAVDDGVVISEFNCVANGPINTVIEFYFYIDHPTFGIIDIKKIPVRLSKNLTDENINLNTILYNGTDSDAKTYGFKVSIEAQGGDALLKGRSILSITG